MLIAESVDFLFLITHVMETTLVNAISVSAAYFIKWHDAPYSTKYSNQEAHVSIQTHSPAGHCRDMTKEVSNTRRFSELTHSSI